MTAVLKMVTFLVDTVPPPPATSVNGMHGPFTRLSASADSEANSNTLEFSALRMRNGYWRPGFLIGSHVKRMTSSVSDSSDETVEKCEDFTTIQGYHVLSRTLARPYNSLGQFDSDLLLQHVETLDRKNIVGYFRFRRQTLQLSSQRERAMMRNLINILPGCTLFTLLTSALASEEGDTHSYYCSMWKIPLTSEVDIPWIMTKVPIEIVNMMENTQQYKAFISNSGSSIPSSQSELQLCQLIDTKAIAKQYETIYTKSLDCLEETLKKLLESERRLALLRKEVEVAEDSAEDDDLMGSVIFTPSLQTPGVQTPSLHTPSIHTPCMQSPQISDDHGSNAGDMIDLLS